MDAEDKFLEAIQKRKRNDLHLKFFEEDGEIQYITTPLFTSFTGKKRIIAYRNTHCIKPECIYDEQELINRFKQSGFSTFATFICHTCRKQIQLLKFTYDQALESILEDVWKHYNKESKLICEKVKIYRNGTWEPILPAYIKNLEQNLRRELEGQEPQERKIPGYDVPDDELDNQDNILNKKSAVKKMVVYKNLIKLTDFDSKEYLHLNTQYLQDSDPMKSLKSLMFKRYGQNILNSDFITVQNETYFPKHIMAFFLKYLEDWANRIIINELDQKSYILNKRNPKLNIAKFLSFFVVKVISYDKFYHLAKYEIWSDNITSIKQRLSKEQYNHQIDKIFIVMHYDERWILTVSDPRTKKIKIVDFLDKELSRIKVDEVDDISRFIIEKELYPVKVNIQVDSPEIKTINFYSDCGFYVSSYLYKAIITDRVLGEIPNFNIKYTDKNRMRDLISWLFLRYAYSDDADQQIQMKDLEPVYESYIEEEKNRQQHEEKELDDYENDMIDRWNLDRPNANSSNSNSQSLRSFSQQGSPKNSKRQNGQGQNTFDNLLSNIDTRDITKKKPNFQDESTILQSQRQSLRSNHSQPGLDRKKSNYSLQGQQYPSNADSMVTNMNIQNQASQQNLQRQQSNISKISQKSFKSSQDKILPPINEDQNKPEIPYFVATKGELNELLQNWHRNLMEDAKQIQKQQEEEELKKKLEKEEEFAKSMKQFGPQNALQHYNQKLDQEDYEKLTELQKRQYEENRLNYHKKMIDQYYSQGIDPKMLDQLTLDDLSSLLLQFQQLKQLDHPELRGIDPKDFNSQIYGLSADPFSQNLGLDYSQLNPQEMMELAQFNSMLQQSIAQTVQKNQKEDKHKRSKSKKKKNKKKKDKNDDKDQQQTK